RLCKVTILFGILIGGHLLMRPSARLRLFTGPGGSVRRRKERPVGVEERLAESARIAAAIGSVFEHGNTSHAGGVSGACSRRYPACDGGERGFARKGAWRRRREAATRRGIAGRGCRATRQATAGVARTAPSAEG